jgi:hypothetical protein
MLTNEAYFETLVLDTKIERSIQEKDLGIIQKDRISEMQKWARNLKAVQRQKTGTEEEGEEIVGRGGKNNINLAIVAANNHYAGFGPGTANLFRSARSKL